MYRGEFEVGSTKFTLDIEDTSGSFAWDFPAMVEVSLGHADAVLLVFSVGDRESFEQVSDVTDDRGLWGAMRPCRHMDQTII